MMPFYATYLEAPKCVFGGGKERPSTEPRFRNLREFGAYDASTVNKAPTILFIFPEEFKPQANQLYHYLRSGNSQFPGMKAVFGVDITSDSVKRAAKFSIQRSRQQTALLYSQAIDQHYADGAQEYDIALVLCDKTAHGTFPSPYYASKVNLAARGVPSQIVTTDLIQNSKQMEWALGNIALQIFVKLGGSPWFVVPSSGAGDIIVGVGRSERTDPTSGKVTRCVGYTMCYDSGGLFRSIEVFKPHVGFYDYLDNLERSVEAALSNLLAEDSTAFRLVLHVPKRFSRAERERVEGALCAVKSKKEIEYVVLRVDDHHPFKLFDLSHTTMAPESGLSVALDDRNRLLLLEGRPAEGMMRKPIADPLWVTLQASSSGNANMDALSQQIYDLATASWRAFNARAKPITTHYAKLVSEILASEQNDQIVEAISANDRIKGVPWFI